MHNIWIFAEKRSGSTAFSRKLATMLNKQAYFELEGDFEKYKDVKNSILYSHNFELIKYITDPNVFCIRTTRKDKVQQILSWVLIKGINKTKDDLNKIFWNVRRENAETESKELFNNIEPLIVTKHEIVEYVKYLERCDKFWTEYASNFQNTTVYYEDLCNGIHIPHLDLHLNINDEKTYTVKLPEGYKEKYCYNHVLVKKWIVDYLNK